MAKKLPDMPSLLTADVGNLVCLIDRFRMLYGINIEVKVIPFEYSAENNTFPKLGVDIENLVDDFLKKFNQNENASHFNQQRQDGHYTIKRW